MRVRLRYSVNGRIRFISHLDLMRAFFRACIRKNIPVAVSCGYSPHLKLSFGPPLSVGVSSSCEYVDMYLEKSIAIEQLRDDIQTVLPDGIQIDGICGINESDPALSAVIDRAVYSIEIPKEYCNDIKKRISEFLDKESVFVERSKKSKDYKKQNKVVNIRPLINKLELQPNNKLLMDAAIGQRGSVKPIEILKTLWPELKENELKLWKTHREELTQLF